MRRGLLSTLLAALGTATACDVDEPMAPTPTGARPAAEVAVTALATVLGKTTVDDEGEVGEHTSLVSSSDGTQRIAYVADRGTGDHLEYASCSANCTSAGNWQRGVIDPSYGTGFSASLKVKSGVRHVVYFDAEVGQLKYARCSDGCLLEGNWKKGGIVKNEAQTAGQYPSLAIGGSGRLYVSYVDGPNWALKYGTCLSGCTSAANWQHATVDGGGLGNASLYRHSSIAIGADGRRHISYRSGGKLKYATCLAECTNAANWQKLTVDQAAGTGGFSSLTIDGNGARHISYYDSTYKNLKYARCASNCLNSAGWGRVTVDQGSGTTAAVGQFTSLAVGGDGTVHVSYYSETFKDLRYARCVGSCLQSSSWSRQTVDGICLIPLSCPNVGRYSSLALGGGRVHISYYRDTGQDLRYLELTQ
jgi:hypothetical protein